MAVIELKMHCEEKPVKHFTVLENLFGSLLRRVGLGRVAVFTSCQGSAWWIRGLGAKQFPSDAPLWRNKRAMDK